MPTLFIPKLTVGEEYRLDTITLKLGRKTTPITLGDYTTIVDSEDGLFYIFKISDNPGYHQVYKLLKVVKWARLINRVVFEDDF